MPAEIELLEEYVDIYQLPAQDPKHLAKAKVELTIGDLHANAIKLLFLLVKHGIITKLTKNQYDQIVSIYKTPVEQLSAGDLQCFNDILDQTEIINQGALVRLMGDETADRGMNDYFTFIILARLSRAQVPVEILLSNHGLWFIEAMELYAYIQANQVAEEELRLQYAQMVQKSTGTSSSDALIQRLEFRKIEYQLLYEKIKKQSPSSVRLNNRLIQILEEELDALELDLDEIKQSSSMRSEDLSFYNQAFERHYPIVSLLPFSNQHYGFAKSMSNMQYLISKGLVDLDEFLHISQTIYKPMLKLIGYTLHHQGTSINIYTHARSGLKTIQDFAKKMQIPYQDETTVELGKTIDAINARLSDYLQQNRVHELYHDKNISIFSQQTKGRYGYVPNAPVEVFTWNRTDHPDLLNPARLNDIFLYFTHGHSSTHLSKKHIFNLDNLLGKTVELNQGIYTILYSQQTDLSPKAKEGLSSIDKPEGLLSWLSSPLDKLFKINKRKILVLCLLLYLIFSKKQNHPPNISNLFTAMLLSGISNKLLPSIIKALMAIWKKMDLLSIFESFMESFKMAKGIEFPAMLVNQSYAHIQRQIQGNQSIASIPELDSLKVCQKILRNPLQKKVPSATRDLLPLPSARDVKCFPR